MRKPLLILILALLVLPFARPARADGTGVTVILNGVPVVDEGPPAVLVDGRTLVPLEWFPSLLGTEPRVSADRWVMVGSFQFDIGSPEIRLANRLVRLDVPPQRLRWGEREVIYLPLRFLMETAGGQVHWDGAARTVHVWWPWQALPITDEILDAARRVCLLIPDLCRADY